ncbi:hypothetical protein Tco_0003194 [Tanacetum coccineum]
MVPVVNHVPSARDTKAFETDDIPEEDMPPRRRFILTAPLHGCDVAESSAAAIARAPRAADRVEDVGYVRALQDSEHRMMTSIKEVNLRVSYQAHIHRQESASLTWWNGYMRTLGHDAAYAMTWGTLKKKLMDKYCPKGKIKKLELNYGILGSGKTMLQPIRSVSKN